MKYLMMSQPDRQELYAALASMPDFLTNTFAAISDDEVSTSFAENSFSPVEHCWHLADLEREGFAVRIQRLLAQSNPKLENFDGALVAQKRQYKRMDLANGIATFRKARLNNLAVLQAIDAGSWTRQGEQEGVGSVMLCDIPVMMAEHDAAHRKEITEWLVERKR